MKVISDRLLRALFAPCVSAECAFVPRLFRQKSEDSRNGTPQDSRGSAPIQVLGKLRQSRQEHRNIGLWIASSDAVVFVHGETAAPT